MTSRLLSLKITGRTAAAAVYLGRELHYIEARQLASDLRQAQNSIVAFSSSLIAHFRVDSAVSEQTTTDTRARTLFSSLAERLRELAIPYWEIAKETLFEAYSESPLKSTQELRSIVRVYWPHIIDEQDERTCLDAAALGLYLQTERMLSDNSSLFA